MHCIFVLNKQTKIMKKLLSDIFFAFIFICVMATMYFLLIETISK